MKKVLIILSCFVLASPSWGQTPNGSAGRAQPPIIPWNGFELFAYLSSKFPVKLVDNFAELEASPKGILIVLGNEAADTLFWSPSVENWVRRGGSLLVATDEKPIPFEANTIERLTGYIWGDHFIKRPKSGALEGVSQDAFDGNQFVFPTEWKAPILVQPKRQGLLEVPLEKLLPFGSERHGQVFLNKPGYLLPHTQNKSTQILGKLPYGMTFVGRNRDLPIPTLNQPFGCISYPGDNGLVIQLADQDLFNNQMLELKDNVEFAWWCLETLCRGEKMAQKEPIPLLLLVGGRVQRPFQMPQPPLPLPDVDPLDAARLAIRAVDDVLPIFEEPDGPFARFSRQLAERNYLQNIIGILGFCLAGAGIYYLIRYRAGFRARETAKQNALFWSNAPKPAHPRAMAQKTLTDDLLKEMETILHKRQLAFWDLPHLQWVQKTPGSDPRGERKFEQSKKEILGFICRNRHSLQNTKPSQIAKIRDLLSRLSDQLEKGLVKPTGKFQAPGAIQGERSA